MSDTMKYFGCGAKGHLIRSCPENLLLEKGNVQAVAAVSPEGAEEGPSGAAAERAQWDYLEAQLDWGRHGES